MKAKARYSFVFCLLLFLTAALPCLADTVPVTVGAHEEYTRVVFSFPKLTAYYVKKTEGGVELTFDTPHDIASPSKLPDTISGFAVSRADAETVKVVIGAAGEPKAYRLLRKVVVDLYPAGKAPEQKAKENKTPPETAAAKPAAPEKPAEAKPAETKAAESKPEPKAATAPQPASPQKAAAEQPKKDEKAPVALTAQAQPPAAAPAKEEAPKVPPAPAPAATAAAETAPPAVPVTPVAAEPANDEKAGEKTAQDQAEAEKTVITISTITPTRLAVFQRFGTLWLVTNSETDGAFDPKVSGPLAGFLGKARFLKFSGGTAWRYVMPPDAFVSVTKKNLLWEVALFSWPQLKPKTARAAVQMDRTSGKAKLMTQLEGAGDVISFEDPSAGDTLFVAPTDHENARVEETRRFPDLAVLAADMGLVVRPLGDGMKAVRLGDYIFVTAPQGIDASPDVVATVAAVDDADKGNDKTPRLFDFLNWRQGGLKKLAANQHMLEMEIAAARTPEERTAGLMKLAQLYFANNFGQETLGVLALIEAEDEDMAKNPTFIAMSGAANAMAGHYTEALKYLSDPALQQHPEVGLWIGYAAAGSELWHKANQSFPGSNRLLLKYPDNIAIPFTLYMAESALRLGRTDTATALLNSIGTASEDFTPQYKTAIEYLKGEAFRQEGNTEAAIRAWKPVASGIDRLYHTKASLALANLLLDQKKIDLKEAIDRVDSLRFAWRGDGLEVQILENLGALKVKNGQFLAGLQDMEQAAGLSDNMMNDSDPIRAEMGRAVADLFVGRGAEKLSPLEAVSIYSEFGNLIPPGADSAAASLHFADYLIRMDLLDRAADILQKGLADKTVPDDQVPATGAKLAAVWLMSGKPDNALDALARTARGGLEAKQQEERDLLKARAFAQLGRLDEATAILASLDSPDARKLEVDVLWRGQKWDAAAKAIEAMLPAPGKKPTDDEARLILNAAVARKLAGEEAQLDALKSRYGVVMAQTPVADAFGVVTRDGGVSSLADRDTLLKMAGEVDMFKGFLDSYKAQAGKGG